MKKLASFCALCLFLVAPNAAKATLLQYNLYAPDTGTSASFVFNEGVIDGTLYSNNLVSITGNFGDGLFTYTFASPSSGNCGLYDTGDLSLIRWTCGEYIVSTNASAGHFLTYAHTWFDRSSFSLAGYGPIDADWNGAAINLSGSTDLNVANSTGVPEPSTLALLTLGLAGLGFSRRKKQIAA